MSIETPWSHELGALALAPLPSSKQSGADSVTSSPASISSESSRRMQQLWPVVLYPSWSKAVLKSGLVNDLDSLKIVGVKKAILVKDLAKNRVPKRVALGSASATTKFRPKVVAHYLGFGEDASWTSISAAAVQKYSIESCKKILIDLQAECGRADSVDNFASLYQAMQEASILLEKPSYKPENICADFNIQNNFRKLEKQNGAQRHEKSNASNQNNDEAEEMNFTPENFDDWRQGGNTQKGTQTQDFSQCSINQL